MLFNVYACTLRLSICSVQIRVPLRRLSNQDPGLLDVNESGLIRPQNRRVLLFRKESFQIVQIVQFEHEDSIPFLLIHIRRIHVKLGWVTGKEVRHASIERFVWMELLKEK